MYPVLINERVEKIKDDEKEINCFIEEYKPFIASCVEKCTGRYVRYGEDDELSIGLMAFAESIRSYDSKKGNFLSFAQNVIKRRLIDYYRKEKKHTDVISLNEYMTADENEMDLSLGESIEKFTEEEISEYRRMELLELKKELSQWDITFAELVDASPKHEKTRKIYNLIIKYMLSRPDLLHLLKSRRYLPVKEICKGTGIPRKTIERARKYIITALIIITGNYEYIKSFVEWGVSL